jgi:hypothetical protein
MCMLQIEARNRINTEKTGGNMCTRKCNEM